MPDIKVQLPDGNTASFPDGTAHDVMERAIQQHLGWKSPQTQAAANTNSNPAAQGEVRPSAPATQGTFERGNFSTLDRTRAMFQPLVDHLQGRQYSSTTGAPIGGNLADFKQYYTSQENEHRPIGRAIDDFASDLTNAPGLITIAGMKYVPGALGKVLDAHFRASMIEGVVDRFPALKEAWQKNDHDAFWYNLTHIVLGTASAKFGGDVDAAAKDVAGKGEVKPATTTSEKMKAAGVLPEAKSQLAEPFSFNSKPPTEAQAPKTSIAAKSVEITKVAAAPGPPSPVKEDEKTQALIAPLPSITDGYAGTPVPLTRFPKSIRDDLAQQGQTKGLGKVDLFKPKPPVPVDNVTVQARATEILRQSSGNRTKADAIEQAKTELAQKVEEPKAPKVLPATPKEEVVAKAPEPQATPEGPSTPQDLLTKLTDIHTRMANHTQLIDGAENDSHAADLQAYRDKLEDAARTTLHQGLLGLSTKDIPVFRDTLTKTAERYEAQAKAITELTDTTVKSRGINKELSEMLAIGGPAREIVAPDGTRAYMKPDAEVKGGLRFLIQTLRGEKPRFEYKLNGTPDGRNPEEFMQELLPQLQRREEVVDSFKDIVEHAKDLGISVQEAADHKGTSLQELQEEMEGIDSRYGKFYNQEPAKRAVLNKPRVGPDGKETMLGSGIGRRPKAPIELDEHGMPKSQGPLDGWTDAKMKAVFGGKYKQIKGNEEAFYKEADQLSERGQLMRQAAADADKEILTRKQASQGGFIGDGPRVPGRVRGDVERAKLAPQSDDFLAKSKAFFKGMPESLQPRVLKPGEQGGYIGFLVLDSKGQTNWVGIPRTHSEFAEALYPELKHATKDTALQTVLANPNIVRKAHMSSYEIHDTTNRGAVHMIDMDTLADRVTNRELYIDTKDRIGAVRTLTIPPEWNKLHEAIEIARNKDITFRLPSERGSTGVQRLTGMAAGGVAGGVAGTAIGGPIGGAIGAGAGMIVGATAHDIMTSPRMDKFLNNFIVSIHNTGMSLNTFLKGAPEPDIASPEIKAIRQAQDMHQNRGAQTWMDRFHTLAQNYAKGVDPFAMIADPANQSFLNRAILKMGEGTTAFNKLKLPDEQSLYLAAKDAKGVALGGRADMKMTYNAVMREAKQAGLYERTTDWGRMLQLKRGFDVIQEHMQTLDGEIQKAQQGLSNPNNTVVEDAAFQAKIKELQGYKDAVQKRVDQGKAAPEGITPQKLQQMMSDFQGNLNVNDRMKINQYWDRVFSAREKILDMLHNNGLVSTEAYQTYKARGKEYIPLDRIMDDLADNKFHSSADPLNVKQQTVIRELEGSERIPVDPWEALSKADSKAFNQLVRNEVMRHAVSLAQAYPQQLGAEFKKVSDTYRPKQGEQIVGQYIDGKPVKYAVPDYLGDVLNGYPQAAKTAMSIYAKWAASAFKRSATVANLSFQLASLSTHALSALALGESNSKDVGRFATSWLSSAKSVLTQDAEFRELVRSGATFGGMQAQLDPEYFSSPSDLGWKEKLAKRQILNVAEDAAATLENINRLTTFKNARLDGHSIRASAIEAKYRGGAPDFSRVGDATSSFGKLFMFMTAHMAYAKQFGDVIRKDPARIGGIMLASAGATMALAYWNSQQKDSDGNPLMRKVSTEERLRNWVLLTPFHYRDTVTGVERAYQVNFPKPFYGQAAINPIEQAFSNVISKEDRTGTQQALDVLGHMSPVPLRLEQGNLASSGATSLVASMHPILKTGIQQFANQDDFGHPIVPQSQQKIDPSQQIGLHTTSTAQYVGQGGTKGALGGGVLGAVVGGLVGGKEGAAVGGTLGVAIGQHGISPRRIDAGMRSMFASSATQTESYLNPFFESHDSSKVSQTPLDIAKSAPIIGPTIRKYMGSGIDQEGMTRQKNFERVTESGKQAAATFAHLQQADPAHAAQYYVAHRNDIYMGTIADKLQKEVQDIDKYMSHLRVQPVGGPDSGLTSETQRLDMLQEAYKRKQNMLDLGLKLFKEGPPSLGSTVASPGQGQGNAR